MGFTHYWNHGIIDSEQWRAVATEAHRLFAEAEERGIQLAEEYDLPDSKPEVNEEYIQFNGVFDDGHETFRISRNSTDFDFCKTARKSYDYVVGRLLKFCAETVPSFEWRNDDMKGNYCGEDTEYYDENDRDTYL